MVTNKESTVQVVMADVLGPVGLDENHLTSALGSLYRRDVDMADLYFN